jgi:hypothetical protein
MEPIPTRISRNIVTCTGPCDRFVIDSSQPGRPDVIAINSITGERALRVPQCNHPEAPNSPTSPFCACLAWGIMMGIELTEKTG